MCRKCEETKCNRCCDKETYDFVIIGAGNAGCVIANRLTENGQFTVCLLEAGRDDARVPQLLPEFSDEQVPQPGEYNWGRAIREIDFGKFENQNRGFSEFRFGVRTSEDPYSAAITYGRASTWGGCTSHHGGAAVRNAPYSWQQWLDLGLTEYDALDVNGPLVQGYRRAENRSQQRVLPSPIIYYDPAIAEPNAGAFPNPSRGEPPYYGYCGEVPYRYVSGSKNPNNPDVRRFTDIVYQELNLAQGFDYPNDGVTASLRDMDWPLTADEGGVFPDNFSYLTTGDPPTLFTIQLPSDRPGAGTVVDARDYNIQNYGDNGALYTPELTPMLGTTDLVIGSITGNILTVTSSTYGVIDVGQTVTISEPHGPDNAVVAPGTVITAFLTGAGGVGTYMVNIAQNVPSRELWIGYLANNRVSAANTYLYPALTRENLTVKSEVLVTKLIVCKDSSNTSQVKGVRYLKGWNIYQTGRNPNVLSAGYGGTVGDARYNGEKAWKNGEKRVFARREVILCAGAFNSPQILMLSGIGDPAELNQHNITLKHNLPGVGKHLLDDPELQMFFGAEQLQFQSDFLAAFVLPTDPFPKFDITNIAAFNGVLNLETLDLTMSGPAFNNNWLGLRNLQGLGQQFNRSNWENILQNPDPTLDINPVSGAPGFYPFLTDMWNGMSVFQNTVVKTEGYVRLQSKNPTVPPKLIYDYLSHPDDMDDFMNILNRTVFPIILRAYNDPIGTRWISSLLFPSARDILIPGVTEFVYGAPVAANMALIDQDKLRNFLKTYVEGHHAMGTCKMGLISDPLAVVDQKSKVHGVKGLRVCDMSIVPVPIRWPANNLYAIAEKISADILAEYGYTIPVLPCDSFPTNISQIASSSTNSEELMEINNITHGKLV